MAAKVLGEELLAVGDALVLGRPLQAGSPPALLGTLNDEGARLAVERIGMDLEQPVVVLPEDEGEGVEHQGGSEPDELRAVHVLGGPKGDGQRATGQTVDPVGGDDQVGVAQLRQLPDLPVEDQADAQIAAAFLEDLEESLAGDGREHVPARPHRPAPVADVDGAPPGERVGDLRVGLEVRVPERPQGLL